MLVFIVSTETSSSKVVTHFYHTDDKILLQGSSLIQGVSSVVWLVDYLIKPLTSSHITNNKETMREKKHIRYVRKERIPTKNRRRVIHA